MTLENYPQVVACNFNKMKFKINTVLILSTLISVCLANSSGNKTETIKVSYDAKEISNKSNVGILKLRGFKVEVHYAITEDGYHLHLVRIINPLLPPGVELKRPVLFNHGLFESSTIWLINSRDVKPAIRNEFCHSLPINAELAKNSSEFRNTAMMLANNGYDVWLLSMRGTDYSMNHELFDTSSEDFWDYSLDNFALDDVPTAINYIRHVTNAPKVGYIGHSQATWSVFSLLASRPNYANIIEPVVTVGPFAYMYQIKSVAASVLMSSASDWVPTNGALPESSKRIRQTLTRACSQDLLLTLRFGCKLLDAVVGGFGDSMPAGYFSHVPFFTSNKVVRHFGQLIRTKKYQMYDHGADENLKRYGKRDAPQYDLAKIKSNSLVLIWSKTDTVTTPEGVHQLIKELKVKPYKTIYIDSEINHFGLITSEDSSFLVNAPILEVFETFSHEAGQCGMRLLPPNPPPSPQSSSSPSMSKLQPQPQSAHVDYNHISNNLMPHDDRSQSGSPMQFDE